MPYFFITEPTQMNIYNHLTSLEPVNEILATSEWWVRELPAPGPKPGTTFTTPAGIPASFSKEAKYNAVSGVCSAGLTTTVQPWRLKKFGWGFAWPRFSGVLRVWLGLLGSKYCVIWWQRLITLTILICAFNY